MTRIRLIVFLLILAPMGCCCHIASVKPDADTPGRSIVKYAWWGGGETIQSIPTEYAADPLGYRAGRVVCVDAKSASLLRSK